nr:S-layer homology domain-containing protein [Clostridia bacterium]
MKKTQKTGRIGFGRILSRAAAVCIPLIIAFTMCAAVSAHSFRDVKEFDEAIDLLSGIEVIKGYSNTSFGPNDNVTRWQMALLISKLRTGRVETSVWEATGSGTAFTDVEAARHYPSAINYAHNNGIIIGRTSDVFAPDDNITVQDGITMCVRALGYPRSSYDSGYPNSYISKGKELGLFEGLYNLSYTATLTRGQTAQMLYNALFAPQYSGSTLADDAFGFVDTNIVLAATEDLRIDTNVKYASSGTYVFAEINGYGRLGDSFELDAGRFDFDNPNDAIGTMYAIRATDDFDTILSLEQVSRQLASSKTTSLTVNANSTITMGGINYTVVPGTRSYALETGKTPSTKEIIMYAVNDDLIGRMYNSGNQLTAKKLEGTTGYYSLTAYDDNGDGYADRGFYKAYSFGQYKADTSGRLAIANNMTASQITITGASAKDGDYVIYSYDSQTKTLDIYKVLSKIEGTLSGYNSANSTIAIDNVSYYLGSKNVRGADPATVGKEIIELSGANTRKAAAYVDTETKIIFVAELQGEEISLSGNYYFAGEIGMISRVYQLPMYDSYTGSYNTSQVSTYPVVYFDGNTDIPYVVGTIDGTQVTTSNMAQLLKPGTVVRKVQVGSKYDVYSGGSGMPATRMVVNLTTVDNKASFTTSTSSMLLGTSIPSDSSAPTLIVSDQALNVVHNIILQNNNVTFTLFDGYYNVTTYDYSTLISEDWQYEQGSSTLDGKPFNGYYSFYIAGQPYYMSAAGNTSAAYQIYVRPFDFSSYAATSTSYNGIVFISDTSRQFASSVYNPSTGSYNIQYNNAFNLSTGTVTTAYLVSTKGSITTSGYYKTLNGYIIDTTPVTTNIVPSTTTQTGMSAGTQITLLFKPSVSFMSGTTQDSLYASVNGQTYFPQKSNIRIYRTTNTAYSGTTLSELDSTQFDTMLSLILSNTSYIQAIYMETPAGTGAYYPGSGPFYIII